MKLFFIILCATALAWAQSTSTVYQRDINGRRTALRSSTSSTKGGETQLYQTINGRQVPLEQTTETVLSETAKGKVTERITKRYDRNGQLTQTQRTVIEETSRPGGVKQVRETTYNSNINGTMQETERRTSETRVQGQTTTTNVTVDRPSVSGAFATAERRQIVTTGPETNQQTNETVLRADGNGGFREMLREVTTSRQSGDQTVTNTSTYEPDEYRRLALSRQTVTTTTTERNGTEVTETNLYATGIPGVAQYNGARMQLQEQQVIERRPAADGSVTETFSVRRPTLADPNRLGPLQQISQTVCVGKCQPDEPAAPPSAVSASTTTAESAARPDQSAQADAAKQGAPARAAAAQAGPAAPAKPAAAGPGAAPPKP